MNRFACAILFAVVSAFSHAQSSPVLNFSDLITGPDVGIGDGVGSGVIVTVWGQGLGSTQGNGRVLITDSAGVTREAAHVYYWKNADGLLPGGPSNLYASHRMQEIAFSIPDSAQGAAEIYIEKGGDQTNPLPFTVRTGAIYHVKASGSDSNGNGSFNSPWRTIRQAEDEIDQPGATLYVHDSITEGNPSVTRAVYINNPNAAGDLTNQYGFVGYPNSQPVVIGQRGFMNFRTSGQVVSKFRVLSSNCNEGANGQPTGCNSGPTAAITTTAFGRAVGNYLSDSDGDCASASGGAIVGSAQDGDRVSAYQILGNEIDDYGCEGASKLHHTTYLSIRSNPDNIQVAPWRFGWNYLHDNKVKNGIHQYDETGACGDITGTVKIHDNVIVSQAGAGIFIGSTCGWSNDWEVYNNVVINAGLLSDWDGVNINSGNGVNTSAISIQDDDLLGVVSVYNNIFYKWGDQDFADGVNACVGFEGESNNLEMIFRNNICWTDKDKPFTGTGFQAEDLIDNIDGSPNIWYYAGSGSPSNALAPGWDESAIIQDPGLTLSGALLLLDQNGAGVGEATGVTPPRDVYGTARVGANDLGSVEYIPTLPPPDTPLVQ